LKDFSKEKHTAEFIAEEIKAIITKIGPEKFSDAAPIMVSFGWPTVKYFRSISQSIFPRYTKWATGFIF